MKRICVIGAGVSGLAVVKELRELGIDVECYEMMPIVSGVFGSYTWEGGFLTSSTVFTWYSDFPVENRQSFMSWREMVDYMDAYVDHFGFRDRIHLNCRVVETHKTADGWKVRVQRANHSNGHPFHPEANAVEEEEFEREFDHLVLCSGLHNTPHVPDVEGLEGFAGERLHSSAYRDAENYRGKRVVVIGGGESGSDIAGQVSEVASSCTVSLREAPGTLFPRWIEGNTPDIRDDRITYNLPRILMPVILHGQRRFYYQQKEDPAVFRWAADSNYRNRRTPFNSNACKSFGIPEAVVKRGAQLKPEITSVEGSTVRFADGSSVEADTLIFSTGFKRDFSFLEPQISERLVRVNESWKSCVHPELGDSLFMVGFSRPHQINLVTVAEMQARLVAQVLGRKRALPSQHEMRATIEADQTFMKRYFGPNYEKNPALVDYFYYTQGLARLIGCTVPLKRAFLSNPRLGLKLLYSALNGAQYRLQGPGSNWEQASRTILKTPQFKNWTNAIVRWITFTNLTTLSAIVSKFRPEFRSVIAHARASTPGLPERLDPPPGAATLPGAGVSLSEGENPATTRAFRTREVESSGRSIHKD